MGTEKEAGRELQVAWTLVWGEQQGVSDMGGEWDKKEGKG